MDNDSGLATRRAHPGLLIIGVALFGANAHADGIPWPGGYVAGNFGISSQVSETTDSLEQRLKVNPPKLGIWLQNFANGSFWVENAEGTQHRLTLRPISISHTYPEYSAVFAIGDGVQLKTRIFAPLSLASKANFLPVTILKVEISSDRPWHGNIGYTLVKKPPVPDTNDDPTPWLTSHRLLTTRKLSAGLRGGAFLAVATESTAKGTVSFPDSAISLLVPVEVAGGTRTVTFLIGDYHSNGYYAREFTTVEALLRHCVNQLAEISNGTEQFKASLPSVGDSTLDRYIPWYTSAAILLTKGLRDGTVLTMGYVEMNPRDSFWTSGIHLAFWPNLERKMILEQVKGQLTSGRIPVTILPLINRGDELDSSEYFILRVSRFYHWYRDREFLRQTWPAVRKAISYLASRDLEHVGVPEQTSYWADWKDVPAVTGRKYIPDVSLMWIASLKAAIEMAHALNDEKVTGQYGELLQKGEAFTNRPFDEGGLWDRGTYRERWADGRPRDNVLEDQLLGIYFNVVSASYVDAIYKSLKPNETPWGVRETFPYRSGPYPKPWTEVSGTPGEYHNGGIWPWANFMDAAGRFAHGRGEEAERIIREVGDYDLAAGNDFEPGEYLNGDTGKEGGSPIQGWSSDLFSAVYFGEYGIERVSDAKMTVHVRTEAGRDFLTRLMLPTGSGRLSSLKNVLKWEPDDSSEPATVEILDERWKPTH